MPGHRSPYSRRTATRSRNVVPKLVIGTLACMVIGLGLFLMADQLGGQTLGSSTTPVASNQSGSDSSGSPTGDETVNTGSAREVAEAYARYWSAGEYGRMYQLLSPDAQRTISEADFVERYQGIDQEVGLTSLEATVGDASEDASEFPLHVVRESGKAGRFEEDNTIRLVSNGRDGNGWGVDWTPSLIFADLSDGYIRWNADVPQRGRILDRKGRPLAHLGTIRKVGIVPGQIEDEEAMLAELSELLQMTPENIKARYEGGQPDWFMPLRNFSDQMDQALLQQIAAIPGVTIQQWPERVYPAGPAAAHIVGYLSEVTAEELPEMSKLGYSPGDMVGRAGVERWAEEYLAGKRGGRLTIVGPDGTERKVIAEVKSEPAADVILTIDVEVQMAADESLGDKVGSSVVIDPSNGAVLAMASRPTFDPNQFILGHTEQTWAEVSDPERRPLENRATQFRYPNGSTFKVVTMAAAMEELDMNGQTTVECPATFSIPGTDNVWRDHREGGQGTLSLHNALVQSCNTVFYEIGAELDTRDSKILPEIARGFGFGAPTGIPEIFEIEGVVPDPDWKVSTVGDFWARGDAVNLSIGQGYFLATPLQVANAYAAIANGGTLWQPYLVQEVTALDDEKLYTAEPKQLGELPLSDEHLNEIRQALRDVVSAPNGTALTAFEGDTHQSAGKTGTAENDQGEAHAWFAAFAPFDAPNLAMVTMVEHGGEGSSTAAPIARQIIDAYYLANP